MGPAGTHDERPEVFQMRIRSPAFLVVLVVPAPR